MRIPLLPRRKPKERLSSIRANGPMVELVMTNGRTELITRKEALHRARAVVGDRGAQYMVEALIKAANEAKINETGYPYASRSMEALLRLASKAKD